MSEDDKADLEAFCQSHRAETAQRWLNRMNWPNGHEKMITFGVALSVRGAASGVWCYYRDYTPDPLAPLDSQQATYCGTKMTWENWSQPIIEYLDKYRSPTPQYSGAFSDTLEKAIMLSYQSPKLGPYSEYGLYMTLPGEEYKTLKEWVYQYLSDGRTPFPYAGDIPGGDYSFTIDFEKDIEIVRAYNLKREMGQYNQQHNAEHNKQLGRKQTKKRFEDLHGDTWTTQEILAQGFSRKTLDKFVEHGLIERVKQGHYVRKSV